MAKPLYLDHQKAYILEAKSRPTDRIQVEIGDTKDVKTFQPQVKLMRWDNEVNASIRLVDSGIPGTPSVSDDGSTITWKKGQYLAKFYQRSDMAEGGFEFEVHLPKNPPVNYLDFTVNTKGLEWFYQPALTQEEIDQGVVRPENVVGSYAVYYKNCPANYVGGKEYKAGKAFHVYRPHVVDADGNETWGVLSFDEAAGILRISIDQEWLNNAVYPVIVDPTFGYESAGASVGATAMSYSGSLFTGAAGTLDKITGYLTMGMPGGQYAYLSTALYQHSDLAKTAQSITLGGYGWHGVGDWWQDFTCNGETITNTDYVVTYIVGSGQYSAIPYIKYDNGDTNQGHSATLAGSNVTPLNGAATMPTVTHTTKKYSLYATYTAASSDQTLSTDQWNLTYGQQTVTTEHTTDAFLRHEGTTTHTTDFIKRITVASLFHLADANKKLGTSSTHTTDALKRGSYTTGHKTDAAVRLATTITHTIDALKRIESAVGHTTDAELRLGQAATAAHTTDANKKLGTLATHKTDVIKRIATQTTYTTDAVIRQEKTLAHTADALLRGATTLAHTADANVYVPTRVTLNTDEAYDFGGDTTPTLAFTGTDTENDKLLYEVQVGTENGVDFESGILIDASSATDTGFGANTPVKAIQDQNGNSWSSLANTTYNGMGQSFTVGNSGLRTSNVKIAVQWAWGEGAPATPTTIRGYLYTSSANFPGSLIATSTTTYSTNDVPRADGGGNPNYIILDFAFDQPLAANTKYVFFCRLDDNISPVLSALTDSANQYAGGQFSRRLTDGSYTSNSSYDMYFEVWGGETLYAAGSQATYTVAPADELAVGTYYWRARAIDPLGNNTYSDWSEIRSFIISQATYSQNHTTDALVRAAGTISHGTDAVNRRASTVAHATDTVRRAANLISHTTDAQKRAAAILSYKTDAVVRKASIISHTTDSVVRKVNLISHKTDANLYGATALGHKTDALIRQAIILSHKADAFTHHEGSGAHTTDAIKRKAITAASHTTDALKRAAATISHKVDAIIRKSFTASHTTDVNKKLGTLTSHKTDANKKLGTLTSHTADVVKRTMTSVGHTTDVVIRIGHLIASKTDAIIRKAAALAHITDVIIGQANLISLTTDAVKRAVGLVSHKTDANKKLATTIAHLADANLKKGTSLNHKTDSLKRIAVTTTFTADAYLRKGTSVGHNTDIVKRGVLQVAHTTDVVKRIVTEVNHTTDINKKLGGTTITHTGDANLKGTFSTSHATDVFRRTSSQISHLADAYMAKQPAVDHTVDAYLTRGGTPTHTTDAVLGQVITYNPKIIYVDGRPAIQITGPFYTFI